MVFCPYCGRSFGRNEHLQRHLLIHTKVLPFKCCVCNISFARRDAIQKHYQSHTQDEIEEKRDAINESMSKSFLGGNIVEKPRSAIACDNCAKSKTRCDHKHPCHRCQSKGLACISRAPRRSRTLTLSSIRRPLQLPSPLANDMRDRVQSSQRSQSPETIEQAPASLEAVSLMSRNAGRVSPVGSSAGPRSVLGTQQQMVTAHVSSETRAGVVVDSPGHSIEVASAEPRPFGVQPTTTNHDRRNAIAAPEHEHFSNLDHFSHSIDAEFEAANNLSRNTGLAATQEDFLVSSSLSVDETMALMNPETSFADIDYQNPDLEANFFAMDTSMEISYGHAWNMFHFPSPKDTLAFPSPKGATHASMNQGVSTNTEGAGQGLQRKHREIIPELFHWNICNCTPVQSATHPEEAGPEAFSPSQLLTIDGSWSDSIENWRAWKFQSDEHITQVCLTEETRDWMLVALQNFLRLSREFHGMKTDSNSDVYPSYSERRAGKLPPSSFMLLPPNRSMQRYLEIYLTSFEPFFPSIPALSLNPNKLATSSNERGATLLLLLMVALGAMLDPALKARSFSNVLFEICRHTIMDTLEKDEGSARGTLIFHCALLFVFGAAFSGKRLHMDFATCQRHMFLELVRHANFFQPTSSTDLLCDGLLDNLDVVWQKWMDQENASRLAYLWVLADLEISLFYENPTRMNVSDLEVALPSSERLWLAPTAAEWKKILDAIAHKAGKPTSEYLRRSRLGLDRLFMLLLSDRLDATDCDLQPMHLRLLLYPIHNLVSQVRQLLICFAKDSSTMAFAAPDSLASSAVRIGEAQKLLRRWYELSREVQIRGVREDAATKAALILYHLINLNLYVSFRMLEKFARGDAADSDITSRFRKEWIQEPEQTIVHCGQILRIVRSIDVKLRPIWWSAAIYRVTIILWTLCTCKENFAVLQNEESVQQPETVVRINCLEPEDPGLLRFLRTKKGHPCLDSAGKCFSLRGEPRQIHRACVAALEGGPRTSRFTEGVQIKLETMGKLWDGVNAI